MTSQPPPFLLNTIPSRSSISDPHITLTYAQSLDAKIAGRGRKQVRLSGTESMEMTHWMRTLHEGILIGVGTLLNDDPRLNVRLLPQSQHHLTPIPLVIDPHLRTPTTARMIKALTDPETPFAKQPIILTSSRGQCLPQEEHERRKQDLIRAGTRVVAVDMPNGHLPLDTIPSILSRLDIRSLMVEGGASIIQQFLASDRPKTAPNKTGDKQRPLIDSLIITVAPVFIPDGFGLDDAVLEGHIAKMPELEHLHTEIIGRDAVMAMRTTH